MLKFVLAGLIALLCTVGISGTLSWLFASFYRESNGEMIIIPICGHMEDIEFIIRGAMLRRRRAWNGLSKIYVADYGADNETIEIAKKMCGEQSVLEFVEKGSMDDVILNLNKN